MGEHTGSLPEGSDSPAREPLCPVTRKGKRGPEEIRDLQTRWKEEKRVRRAPHATALNPGTSIRVRKAQVGVCMGGDYCSALSETARACSPHCLSWEATMGANTEGNPVDFRCAKGSWGEFCGGEPAPCILGDSCVAPTLPHNHSAGPNGNGCEVP